KLSKVPELVERFKRERGLVGDLDSNIYNATCLLFKAKRGDSSPLASSRQGIKQSAERSLQRAQERLEEAQQKVREAQRDCDTAPKTVEDYTIGKKRMCLPVFSPEEEARGYQETIKRLNSVLKDSQEKLKEIRQSVEQEIEQIKEKIRRT